LEIMMSNTDQTTESAGAPQRKPNLDITSHIAGMPAPVERNSDENAPTIRLPIPPVPW
jgi:hypothetical protein